MPLTTAVKRISCLILFKNGANLIWILSPTFSIAFCYLGNDDAFFTFAANRFHIVYHIHIGQIATKPTFNRQQTLSSNGSPTDSAPILNNMMKIYETSGTETYLGVRITNFGPTPQSKLIFCLEPYIISIRREYYCHRDSSDSCRRDFNLVSLICRLWNALSTSGGSVHVYRFSTIFAFDRVWFGSMSMYSSWKRQLLLCESCFAEALELPLESFLWCPDFAQP